MGVMSAMKNVLRGQPIMKLPAPPPDVQISNIARLVNGQLWPLHSIGGNLDKIGGDFESIVRGAYQGNGVVFACEMARLMLFTQARFQWRRPDGELFGTQDLRVLERPWAGATTGDLLGKMLLYADMGGDAFVVRRGDRLTVLPPDEVIVVSGIYGDPNASPRDVDADELGILHFPGGPSGGAQPKTFLSAALAPNGLAQYAHFMPIPDPLRVNRGMSWLTPVLRDVEADSAMTVHKGKYFDQGATVNLVVSGVPAETADKFKEWVAAFEAGHKGKENAHKTLYLSGETKAEKLGSNFGEAEFRETQGAGEVRICIAANVPAGVVGVSEGLQGSTLNSGNFAQSMRRFADLFGRPYWQNAAGSLEVIVPPPGSGVQLSYSDRHIPALKDDIKDASEVRAKDAQAIRTLVDAGFEPDYVIQAVNAGDLSLLKNHHSGLYSVQLQPPQPKTPKPAPPPPTDQPMPGQPGMKPMQGPTQPVGPSDSGGPA